MGFGVNFFLIFGIGSIATALGGYTADNYGVDKFYWFMAIIAIAALITALTVIAVKQFYVKFTWQLIKENDE
jgi:predicted MFS family arabinose efflux permease